MELKVWMFLLAMTLPEFSSNAFAIVNNNVSNGEELPEVEKHESRIITIPSQADELCLSRLESAMLSTLSTNHMPRQSSAIIDLAGYALHQPLKTAPLDMYVTDIRVKIPANNGRAARIDKCNYDPNGKILQAKMMFQDLVVTGSVKLLNENSLRQSNPIESVLYDKCNMTLRLRQAGLGFVAIPHQIQSGAVGIRTSATFVDPNFISIHAYNCQPAEIHNQLRAYTDVSSGPIPRIMSDEDINQEMEEVFLRGIRSLLTKHMEKQLQPALKDTLMINMGYTVSYG